MLTSFGLSNYIQRLSIELVNKGAKMKILGLLLLCLTLTACEGIAFDDETNEPGEAEKFKRSDLNQRAFFSKEVLQNSINNGFVLLFTNTAEVDEIGFDSSDNDKALAGNYRWTISNDRLQVTYPNNVVCRTEKDDDDNVKIKTKNASCSGGTPKNPKIEDILNKALSLTASNLENRKITIEVGGKKEIIDFNNDNSFSFTIEENGNTSSPENGTSETSVFNNLVKLNFPSSNEFRQWMLMKGNIGTTGSLLDLLYNSSTNQLKEVRVYKINNNSVWEATEVRNDISTE